MIPTIAAVRAFFQPPVGVRHLQCGLDRLPAGIREEGLIKPVRHDVPLDTGQIEFRGMAELKRRHVIEHVRLPCHGFDDFGPIVSETRTYETRSAVENCPAIDIMEAATVCGGDETRIFLELPVARVRQPASVEVRQVMLPFFGDSSFGRVPRGIDFHRSSTVSPLCELCPAPGHVWSVQNRPSLHCRQDVTSSLTDAAVPTGGHSHDLRADAYGLHNPSSGRFGLCDGIETACARTGTDLVPSGGSLPAPAVVLIFLHFGEQPHGDTHECHQAEQQLGRRIHRNALARRPQECAENDDQKSEKCPYS